MNSKSMLLAAVLCLAVLVAAYAVSSGDEDTCTPVVVEERGQVTTDDPVLPYRFAYQRPFFIAISQTLPEVTLDALSDALARKGLLDTVVFIWFNGNTAEEVNIVIGRDMPLGVSQSVLEVVPSMTEQPVILDARQFGGDWDRQGIYIGARIQSEAPPVSNEMLLALLDQEISREDFFDRIESPSTTGAMSSQSEMSEACACSCTRIVITEEGDTPIDVPSFCADGLCHVYVVYDRMIAAFQSGGLFPIYYIGDPAGTWVVGPSLTSFGGLGLSDGRGVNGDSTPQAILAGGTDAVSGSFSLVDDSDAETHPKTQWTFRWAWPANDGSSDAAQHRVNRQVTILICPS